MNMNNKQRKTLKAIFDKPTRADIEWKDIVNLLVALGTTVKEGKGARVRFELNGVFAGFHRPHPNKEAKKYQVDDFRAFLENAGVNNHE
jgi:hypothetical protein